MPVEIVHLTFKPSSFFDQNPALDVPQAADQKSRRAFAENQAGVVDTNGSNGKSCCA
jgi:primary-amine oxidase